MIIWRKNKKLPQELMNRTKSSIEKNHLIKSKYFTTYSYTALQDGNVNSTLVKYLLPFYNETIKEMMIDLGMYDRCGYTYSLWAQMYNSTTTTHNVHQHYGHGEIISWVHFIQTPRQRCFYFLNGRNEKIYPKQNSGDIIAWPPWLLHGVDPIKRKNFNRIISAGNISLTSYN